MKNEQNEESPTKRNSIKEPERNKRKSDILPFTLKWEKEETLKSIKPRFFHASCTIGQNVYIIGGHNDPNNHKDTLTDIMEFNTVKKKWKQLDISLPFGLIGHKCCEVNGIIYVFGGRDKTSKYHSDLHIIDPKKLTIETKKTVIFPRAAHSVVAIGKFIYIFGGVSEINEGIPVYMNDLYVYDVGKKKVKHPPSERAGHISFSIDTDLYIFGGRSSKKIYEDAFIYSTKNNAWSILHMVTPMPKCYGSAFQLYQNNLILWGGTDANNDYLQDLYVFDLNTQAWFIVKTQNEPTRAWHACEMVNSKFYIFGGKYLKKSVSDVFFIELKSLFNENKENKEKEEMKIKIKLIHINKLGKKDNRKLLMPVNSNFKSLEEKILKEYNFKKAILSYIDDERDEITIRTDDGLQEAIDFFQISGKHLQIRVKVEQGLATENTIQLNGMRYLKISRPIGDGKFASVYEAIDIDKCQFFAIKEFKKEFSEETKKSFIKEVEIMKSLSHPNIIKFLDFDVNNGLFIILMEKAYNGSLYSRIESLHNEANQRKRNYEKFNRNFEMEIMARSFTKQILQGLKYLHDKNIVHLDIKGKNIVFCDTGIKIIDFGLAESVEALQKEKPTEIKGTIQYLAPDLLFYNYSTKCDIWSLGCTVIEMITGHAPHHDVIKDLGEIPYLLHLKNGTIEPKIPRISPVGVDFLQKCLERDPLKRSSAEELLKHDFITKKLESDEGYPSDEEDNYVEEFTDEEEEYLTD